MTKLSAIGAAILLAIAMQPANAASKCDDDLQDFWRKIFDIIWQNVFAAPKKRRPMSASCARSCAIWAPATAICRTATCAPM